MSQKCSQKCRMGKAKRAHQKGCGWCLAELWGLVKMIGHDLLWALNGVEW